MAADQAKILIVDDDRELRELIAETLSEYGYDSRAAKNGAELFAALEREAFDLILLDIMMPGEDGLSLCRRRRAPGAPTAPVTVAARSLTSIGCWRKWPPSTSSSVAPA
ncbi:Sensor histidine kinase RcsC [bioreactor metagenome]|uniref:Sensor histidine kinase RcsC n=1 Tax=bioreactor metagenome TaxID=1076179 RepID=A0A645ATK4_9ZZZZ